jgi:hypothetical protein
MLLSEDDPRIAEDEIAMAGGPIRSHSTETSTRSWAGFKTETKLGKAPADVLRKAYAWADPDGDPDAKASYKFLHHEVGRAGDVGPANVKACTSGIGVLNGARGGSNVPDRHREGIYNHLARHLRDAGEDPAPLK